MAHIFFAFISYRHTDIKAAVILDVVFDLGGKVLKTRSWVYIVLMVAAFVANTVFDVNVVVVILAAAVFGVVLALVQWKKGGAK